MVEVTAPEGHSVWTSGVTMRLECVVQNRAAETRVDWISETLSLQEAGYISGTARFPFEFSVSVDSFPETYDGNILVIKSGLMVHIERPWYTFDVYQFDDFHVRNIQTEIADIWRRTELDIDDQFAEIIQRRREAALEGRFDDADGDEEGAGAGEGADASRGAGAARKPKAASPSAAAGKAAGGAGGAGSAAGDDAAAGSVDDVDVGLTVDEMDNVPHILVIPDCDGLVVLDFNTCVHSLRDHLEGELRFVEVSKPFVRAILRIVCIESFNDDKDTHERKLFEGDIFNALKSAGDDLTPRNEDGDDASSPGSDEEDREEEEEADEEVGRTPNAAALATAASNLGKSPKTGPSPTPKQASSSSSSSASSSASESDAVTAPLSLAVSLDLSRIALVPTIFLQSQERIPIGGTDSDDDADTKTADEAESVDGTASVASSASKTSGAGGKGKEGGASKASSPTPAASGEGQEEVEEAEAGEGDEAEGESRTTAQMVASVRTFLQLEVWTGSEPDDHHWASKELLIYRGPEDGLFAPNTAYGVDGVDATGIADAEDGEYEEDGGEDSADGAGADVDVEAHKSPSAASAASTTSRGRPTVATGGASPSASAGSGAPSRSPASRDSSGSRERQGPPVRTTSGSRLTPAATVATAAASTRAGAAVVAAAVAGTSPVPGAGKGAEEGLV